MAHDKLLLIGHVHERPKQFVTHSYSCPLGMSGERASEIVKGFVTAYTPIRIEAVLDGIPGVWYFGNETATDTAFSL